MDQPALPMGDLYLLHPDLANLMTTPGLAMGSWGRCRNALDGAADRYGDHVRRCIGDNGRCSWAASDQLGVSVPAGLNRSSVAYPTMYREKRFRPRR